MTTPSKPRSRALGGERAGTLVLAAVSFCVMHAAPIFAAGEIRGRVVAEDGTPVDKAVVRILADSTVAATLATGPGGAFTATDLEGESFTVRVEARGHAPLTEAGVPAGARVELTLRQGYELRGIVTSAADGRPIPGAEVAAWDRDAEPFGEEARRRTTGGEDGRFVLADLPLGALTLEGRAEGWVATRLANVPVPQPLIDEHGRAREIELSLEKGAGLSGRVVRRRGGPPVGGVKVRLTVVEEDAARGTPIAAIPTVPSDASGAFAFDGLRPGRYRIAAEAKGRPGVERGPFELRAGDELDGIELRLDARAALSLRLVDPDGEPVHGLDVEMVRAARKDGDRAAASEPVAVDADQIVKDENGRFTVGQLDPGVFDIRLTPDGWSDVEKDDVALRNDATTDLGTIVVRAGRSIVGRVTDTNGDPVRHAEIRVLWREGSHLRARQSASKADGRYRVAGIASSPVESVRVRADRYASARRDGDPPVGAPVDFVLEPRGGLSGRAVAADGGPLPALRVRLLSERDEAGDVSAGDAGGRAVIEPSGTFNIEDVDPGTYTIEVAADGHAAVRKAGVEAVAGRIVDVGTFTLESGLGLRGRVVAAASGSPVSAAAIRVDRAGSVAARPDAVAPPAASTYSAGDGSFEIGGLDVGTFDVTVRHGQFARGRARVDLVADRDPPELLIELHRGGMLSGIVVDADGKPVAGAWVAVFDASGAHVQTAVTDAEGRYVIESLPPGTYHVMRIRPGGEVALGPGARTVVILEGETTTADFDAAPAILLHGRVLRGEDPVPDAEISLYVMDGASRPEVKTSRSDGEGSYRIGLDRAGRYRALVTTGKVGSGRATSLMTLVIPEQPDVLQDIVLAVRAISGRVTDANGEPIRGATVTALADGTIPATTSQQALANTDPDGRYRLTGIDEGSYRVIARHLTHKTADVHPVVVSEAVPEPVVDFVLEEGSVLHGRVLDPQGTGVPNAIVMAVKSQSVAAGVGGASTNAKGEFTIQGVSEGPFDISAIPPDWAPSVVENVTPSADTYAPELMIYVNRGGSLRVVVRNRDDEPVPGAQIALQPRPPFPGWDLFWKQRPTPPTDRDGVTVMNLLRPGEYVVSSPLLRGAAPVVVTVYEGSQSEAVIVAP